MGDLSISERIAWIHRDAITLTTGDMVGLKHSLASLIEQATQTLELVGEEIRAERLRLKRAEAARQRAAEVEGTMTAAMTTRRADR